MPITSTHPEYDENIEDWEAVTDSIKESRIKNKGEVYLDKPSGHEAFEVAQPTLTSPYVRYKRRARFPLLVTNALTSLTGVAHKKPGQLTAPDRFVEMTQTITPNNEALDQLEVTNTRKILMHGRHGLLSDVDSFGLPFIAKYDATSIKNWHETIVDGRRVLSKVVLEEQVKKVTADEYEHSYDKVYRVLSLDDSIFTSRMYDEQGNPLDEDEKTIEKANKEKLDKIPFVFAGSIDINPSVDEAPMLELAKIAIAIYNLDADYLQSLHMTAQATPYTTGAGDNEPTSIGSGKIWNLPEGATAGMLEVKGTGIQAHREEIQSCFERAKRVGGELTTTGGTAESGEALKTKMFSTQATTYSVVRNGGNAIEMALKFCAEMVGIDPDQVSYEPNLDFSSGEISEALLNALNASINSLNIPREILWEQLRRSGVTTLEDDEIEALIATTSLEV